LFNPLLGLEAEGMLIPSADNSPANLRLFILAWRAHLILNIAPGQIAGGKLTPFVLAGVGALSVVSTEGTEYNEIKKDTDFVFHAGLGAKYALNELMHLRFDGRILWVPNTTKNGVSPDFELLARIRVTLGGHPPRRRPAGSTPATATAAPTTPTSARRRSARPRTTAAPTSTATRTASSIARTSAPTRPARPSARAAPCATRTATASPTRRTSAP